MNRREFLAALAASAALPSLGRADLRLVEQLARPQDLATPIDCFDRAITPTPLFFVRSHFGPPSLRPARRLRIDGLVDHPLDLDAAAIARMEQVTITCVLQCAGNGRALQRPRVPGVQWTHGAMGQARWTGVRLADLLARAGVQTGATQLRVAGGDRPPMPSVPRYLRGLPLARALDPSTLVAHSMNGAPLTLAHGAPLRLVVPCWSGNHWVKWLTEIHVQKEEVGGFYTQTAYRLPTQPVAPGAAVPPEQTAPVTTFPVKSIIGRPSDGGAARVGRQEVVGVAFSGLAPIARVEVSLDGGAEWKEAALDGEAAAGRWQVFRYGFDAPSPGERRATARATDRAGNVQPAQAQWNPSGYFWNAWHSVAWTVKA